MKPDQTNTGGLEVTQNQTPASTEALGVVKAVPEQAVDKAGELPQNSTTVPGVNEAKQDPNTTATLVAPPAQTATQPTIQPKSAKDQFESQLAQLPAEDVDTIEKVWVEKADEIEEKTKDDPYTEDEAQHSLSRAYLKKRFNLDVE